MAKKIDRSKPTEENLCLARAALYYYSKEGGLNNRPVKCRDIVSNLGLKNLDANKLRQYFHNGKYKRDFIKDYPKIAAFLNRNNRWHDVDVKYELDHVRDYLFWGFDRYLDISQRELLTIKATAPGLYLYYRPSLIQKGEYLRGYAKISTSRDSAVSGINVEQRQVLDTKKGQPHCYIYKGYLFFKNDEVFIFSKRQGGHENILNFMVLKHSSSLLDDSDEEGGLGDIMHMSGRVMSTYDATPNLLPVYFERFNNQHGLYSRKLKAETNDAFLKKIIGKVSKNDVPEGAEDVLNWWS